MLTCSSLQEAEAGHQNRVTTEMRELKISAKGRERGREATQEAKKRKKADDVGLLHPPFRWANQSLQDGPALVAKEALEKLWSTRNRKDKEGKTNARIRSKRRRNERILSGSVLQASRCP